MKTRILLVEDDERLAKLTAEYLCKNDFAVDIEPRGNTAEARILAERPDLVILDVMLPGKDGFEVCRAVRSQYGGVILSPHVTRISTRSWVWNWVPTTTLPSRFSPAFCWHASRPC